MDNNKNSDLEQSVRLPYAAPQLVSYGAVRDLTASGTGTIMEGMSGGASSKFP